MVEFSEKRGEHIFRRAVGHVFADTPANRRRVVDWAECVAFVLDRPERGVEAAE